MIGVRPWLGNPKFSPPKKPIVIPKSPEMIRQERREKIERARQVILTLAIERALSEPQPPTMLSIAEGVAEKHGLTSWREMREGRHVRALVMARWEFWHRVQTETHNSLSGMGKFLGFDHSSVICGLRRYREKLSGEAQHGGTDHG